MQHLADLFYYIGISEFCEYMKKDNYYDHSELTAIWNRLRKRNNGNGSGSGTLSDIIIDDDNEKQSRFLYDVTIDPEDDSRLIFLRLQPVTVRKKHRKTISYMILK